MKSRASEFLETRPIDHVFIARWWSIAMCAPATPGVLNSSQLWGMSRSLGWIPGINEEIGEWKKNTQQEQF